MGIALDQALIKRGQDTSQVRVGIIVENTFDLMDQWSAMETEIPKFIGCPEWSSEVHLRSAGLGVWEPSAVPFADYPLAFRVSLCCFFKSVRRWRDKVFSVMDLGCSTISVTAGEFRGGFPVAREFFGHRNLDGNSPIGPRRCCRRTTFAGHWWANQTPSSHGYLPSLSSFSLFRATQVHEPSWPVKSGCREWPSESYLKSGGLWVFGSRRSPVLSGVGSPAFSVAAGQLAGFFRSLANFPAAGTSSESFQLFSSGLNLLWLFLMHTEAAVPLPWSTRMMIALGAAKGLAFLHNAERPVIYRDFKTSNILLDTDYTAKLSDFGLAKAGPQGDETHVSTRVMGTYGYAAPEYVMTGSTN
ncbi:hypothetical protein Cgig2_011285 [Carnegiea gigantea]|uniref:Protein kinase domain-containing protein n=1 Tax=Carnegiea gigantea TaxID=171969 RepID=A0A9Q1GX10_9CARY|nr:hypothetical protein Cgig2_011285 [Carnegiea gigantea]